MIGVVHLITLVASSHDKDGCTAQISNILYTISIEDYSSNFIGTIIEVDAAKSTVPFPSYWLSVVTMKRQRAEKLRKRKH